jgi:hypothetical protein
MSDTNATHLMFIDADITFSWVSIIKLLIGDKELSGGCYPKKCFNWDKIKHHIQKTPTLKDDELMAKSLDYVFNPIYHKDGSNIIIKVDNGMAQVKDIGTGFMLIKKSVIMKMMLKYPDTKYKNNVAGYGQNNMNDYFYTLFDCAIDPVSKVYLSEDYLFCKRWLDIGGELWLDINTNLNHTGLIDYKGCLSMIIGEVDTLNKDAQILRQQQSVSIENNSTPTGNSKNNVENVSANVSASVISNNILESQKVKKNKKKKKRNKNKNGDGEVTANSDISNIVDNNDNNDNDNEETSDDDDNKNIGNNTILNNNMDDIPEKNKKQMEIGNHC